MNEYLNNESDLELTVNNARRVLGDIINFNQKFEDASYVVVDGKIYIGESHQFLFENTRGVPENFGRLNISQTAKGLTATIEPGSTYLEGTRRLPLPSETDTQTIKKRFQELFQITDANFTIIRPQPGFNRLQN